MAVNEGAGCRLRSAIANRVCCTPVLRTARECATTSPESGKPCPKRVDQFPGLPARARRGAHACVVANPRRGHRQPARPAARSAARDAAVRRTLAGLLVADGHLRDCTSCRGTPEEHAPRRARPDGDGSVDRQSCPGDPVEVSRFGRRGHLSRHRHNGRAPSR